MVLFCFVLFLGQVLNVHGRYHCLFPVKGAETEVQISCVMSNIRLRDRPEKRKVDGLASQFGEQAQGGLKRFPSD